MEEKLVVVSARDLLEMQLEPGKSTWNRIVRMVEFFEERFGVVLTLRTMDYLFIKERAHDHYISMAASHQDQFFLERTLLQALTDNHARHTGEIIHLGFPHIDNQILAAGHKPLPEPEDPNQP